MKILFICGQDHKYGTPTMLRSIIDNIDTNQIEFVVVTQKQGEINVFCNQRGIQNIVVPYRNAVYGPCKNKAKNFIKKQIKKLYVSAYNCFAFYKITRLIQINEIDLIHTNIERDVLGMMLSKKFNIPNITHIREFYNAHFNMGLIYRKQITFMNDNTEQFIAVSKKVREDWIQLGIDKEKILVVYDGVSDTKIKSRQHKEDGITRIVMCGGIFEGKGQIQLLQAAKILMDRGYNNFTICFYGDGNKHYKKTLYDFTIENGLGDVVFFEGYVSNVRELLYEYDIGINCSKSEGFGLVTVEYMLAGLGIILADTGANTEIVANGVTGVYYKYDCIEDLADKIETMINDSRGRRCLGESAREEALKRFSIKQNVDQILELYKNTINCTEI